MLRIIHSGPIMAELRTGLAPAAPFLKAALFLWGLALIGALLVLPYVASLEAKALAEVAAKKGTSTTVLLTLSMVQSAVVLGAAVLAGLWAARKLGLRTPVIDGWLGPNALPRDVAATLIVALAAGVLSGFTIYALDRWVFAPLSPMVANLRGSAHPAYWQGFLASFYGALDEEILMRLGLLSLLALALRTALRLFGAGGASPLPAGIFWVANLTSAVVFGLGHLPATAAILPLTHILVARAIVLNGLGGIVFGALYRRYGLEWAMVAHFGADIVLHVALSGG